MSMPKQSDPPPSYHCANRLTTCSPSGPRTAMQDAKHNGFVHVVQYLKQNGALE